MQRVRSQGKEWEGYVAVPFRSLVFVTLGTGMRADPRSCGKQPPHPDLVLPRESASPRRSKVGSAREGPEAGSRASATAFEVALAVPRKTVA